MSHEVTYAEFQAALEVVRSYKEQCEGQIIESKKHIKEAESVSKYIGINADTNFLDVASVRLVNVINWRSGFPEFERKSSRDPIRLSAFENMSLKRLYSIRGFGWRCAKELKEICLYAGVNINP